MEQEELIRPTDQNLQADAPRDLLKNVKLNTSQMVSRLQQKLPDKEKVIGKMTQAG